jgi:hypothetical protein
MTELSRDCERARDAMNLLISREVASPEVAAARRHLATCAGCRAFLARLQEDEERLRNLASTHDERIRNLTLRAINALPEEPVRRDRGHERWRWIMARRRGGLAAAAAIIVFLVVYFQGTGPAFEAWAEVLETVRQATTAQFRLRDMSGSGIEARQTYGAGGTAHRTYEDGELVEAMYVDFDAGEVLYVAYPLRFATRMRMTDELVQDFRRHDPATTFDFLRDYEYEELGRRRIDGRQAVGIRITDARFLAERMERAELELWVDPESKLPIRFDVTGQVEGGRRTRHVRFDEFVWNEPLPADEFHPEIPAGYRVKEGVELAVDEAHCLEGLRVHAEVVGRYPSTLAYESLKAELWRSPGARDRDVAEMVADMFRIRMASTFYGELVREDRGVVYLGHEVRPGEAARVLMRWRIGEDTYRVIFGDLRAETVSGERLLELEGR